jgi:hypothetical protein
MHQRPTNLAVVFAVGSIFAPNQKLHFRHDERIQIARLALPSLYTHQFFFMVTENKLKNALL